MQYRTALKPQSAITWQPTSFVHQTDLCCVLCSCAHARTDSGAAAEARAADNSDQAAGEQDPPLLHAHGLTPADVAGPPLLHAYGLPPEPGPAAGPGPPAPDRDPPPLHAHGLPPGRGGPGAAGEPAQLHAHGLPPEAAEAAAGGGAGADEEDGVPVEVTNETPSAQRIELYRSRVCLFVTTRILVVDLLSGRVHGNQVRRRARPPRCPVTCCETEGARRRALRRCARPTRCPAGARRASGGGSCLECRMVRLGRVRPLLSQLCSRGRSRAHARLQQRSAWLARCAACCSCRRE